MNLRALDTFFCSRGFWWLVLAVGIVLEASALYYQYVLGEPPCVLCIHARLWVLTAILTAIIALLGFNNSWIRGSAHAGLLVSLALLAERAWVAVLVERGLYEGQCGMDAGFPQWLPLDQWLPAFFEVWTMCGYTPRVPLGVSMGEALLGIAITGLGVSLLATAWVAKQQWSLRSAAIQAHEG